jgi:4-hydroxy-4-methyl-2-oxoglutarate aldolase
MADLEPNLDDPVMVRERMLGLDTATVCDVLDELGLRDQALSSRFRSFPSESMKLGGWAYTIRGEPREADLSGDPVKMRVVESISPGDVTIWSGGDVEGICFFGELIALGMKRRGCAGALIDGGIRDTRWIARMEFAIFARYRAPVQSIGRWHVTQAQVPLELPGATSGNVAVHPRDFVLADEDGVVVIPRAVTLQVLDRAEGLTRQEAQIRNELENGSTLEEVLQRHGHV